MQKLQLLKDACVFLLKDTGQAGRGWALRRGGGKASSFLLLVQEPHSLKGTAALQPVLAPPFETCGNVAKPLLSEVWWPSLHPTSSTPLPQHRQHLPCARPLLSFSRSVHKSVDTGRSHTFSDTPQKARKKGGTQEWLDRLQKAKWALYERRLPPELRDREDLIKNESELIGVVEQRIQQSIREGDFDKLPGQGKPLEHRKNPHIDAAEDLAFRVLNNSGFAPEWVTLNKDIRTAITKWRAALKAAWLRSRDGRWEEERLQLEAHLADINSKILHYNLITPFGRQIMGRKMERELKWLQEELGD